MRTRIAALAASATLAAIALAGPAHAQASTQSSLFCDPGPKPAHTLIRHREIALPGIGSMMLTERRHRTSILEPGAWDPAAQCLSTQWRVLHRSLWFVIHFKIV